MARKYVSLFGILSTLLFSSGANILSLLLQQEKVDYKPVTSPLKSIPATSLRQCATFCLLTSDCIAISYGYETCSVYGNNDDPDALESATGFRYYRRASTTQTQASTASTIQTESTTTDAVPNVAVNMKTSQSSGHNSEYAVDSKYSISMPVLTPICTSTNPDDDTKPWWRYKLDEELVLNKLLISIAKNDQLYNINIRIGNMEINDTALGKEIATNDICVSTKGLLSTKADSAHGNHVNLSCSPPVVGNFVSIQITDFCTDIECKMQDSNILNLCKVAIYPILGNVALRKPAKQCSTYKSYDATIAVDGNIDIGKFFHTEEKDKYDWWRVDLKSDHYIKQVNVYNREGTGYARRFHDVEIRVSQMDIADIKPETVFIVSDDDTLCAKVGESEEILEGKNEFTCNKPLAGRYVSLQIVNDCAAKRKDCNGNGESHKLHVLHVAEVEVIGIPLSYLSQSNVAAGKKAIQSSTYSSKPASLALDGDVATNAATKKETHPWWCIDLKFDHYISAVVIFNNENADYAKRLHDIQIRVSNEDISKIKKHAVFQPTDDSLCAEAGKDEIIPAGGPNVFTCKTALTGRYISIQIVDNCKKGRKDCNHPKDDETVQWLILAEIQAIGLPLDKTLEDIWQSVNLLQLKSKGSKPEKDDVDKYAQSSTWGTFSPALANTNETNENLYIPIIKGKCAFTDYTVNTPAWWLVTLEARYEVEKVVITTPVVLHEYVISVGDSSTAPLHEENTVCLKGNKLSLSSGKAVAECSPALKGKYVSVEILKPCMSTDCVFFKSTTLFLCEVEVQGRSV